MPTPEPGPETAMLVLGFFFMNSSAQTLEIGVTVLDPMTLMEPTNSLAVGLGFGLGAGEVGVGAVDGCVHAERTKAMSVTGMIRYEDALLRAKREINSFTSFICVHCLESPSLLYYGDRVMEWLWGGNGQVKSVGRPEE